MQTLAASLTSLISLVAGPAFLAYPPASTSAPRPSPPIASVAAAATTAPAPGLLDKVQDSVLRVGVELQGVLTFPDADFDEATNMLVPTRVTKQVAVTAYRLGTGFVVDPAGYVVTNAHVVDTSGDSIADDLWAEFQRQFIAEFERDMATNSNLTYEQMVNGENAYFEYLATYASWSSSTYNVVAFNPAKTDAIGDPVKLFESGWSAEIKKLGQPYPQIGKDIAILKIEAGREFSPLVFGDSDEVTAGSSVYVIGYPGIADLSAKSFLIPTLTSGIVSAVKPSDLGDYSVIQIDAAISGGNSGGPVFDSSGRVIGVATFGATEEEGYNWILPISLAQEYLNELNVHPVIDSGTDVAGILTRIPRVAWAGIAGLFFLMSCGLALLLYKRRHHIAPAAVLPTLTMSHVPPPSQA